MSRIRLQFLGGVEVRGNDGRRLILPSRNAAAVLAYLCVSRGRPRSRAQVAGLVWDVWDAAHARGSLRQTLLLLRRTLGPHVFCCEGETLALSETAVSADVWEFEAAAASVAPERLLPAGELYKGEFMEGHSCGRGFAFAEWLGRQRTRLRERALEAIGRGLDQALAQGARATARTAAQRLLAIEPADEAAHRALIRLYASEGRLAQAVRQYELCCQMLQMELGVEPDAETRALHAELMRGRIPPGRGPAHSRRAASTLPFAP
jgi:DNA-binding SARP family transcriptional activator